MNTPFRFALGALMIGSLPAAVTFELPDYSYTPPPPQTGDGNPNAIVPSADGTGPGQDSWIQSEPTFLDADNGAEYPIFYVEQMSGGDRVGTIGGIYAIPDSAPFVAQRDFAPFVTIGQTVFQFQASVRDFIDFDDRNNFGFTLADGATNLLTVDLRPFSQTNATTTWEIFVGIGDAVPTSLDGALVPENFYNFVVEMDGAGVSLEISGGPGDTASVSGSPTGYDPSSTGDLTASFSWSQGEGAGWGDNRMLLNNIEAIPEPASLFLVSFGALGLLRRRR